MDIAEGWPIDIKKAAILARVSTEQRVKGTSLATQVEDCKRIH